MRIITDGYGQPDASWRVHPLYLPVEPFGMSVRSLAENLGVAPSMLNRVVSCKSGISPEVALCLAKALGRSPESWLAMLDHYDLWQARQRTNLDNVRHVELASARPTCCRRAGRGCFFHDRFRQWVLSAISCRTPRRGERLQCDGDEFGRLHDTMHVWRPAQICCGTAEKG